LAKTKYPESFKSALFLIGHAFDTVN